MRTNPCRRGIIPDRRAACRLLCTARKGAVTMNAALPPAAPIVAFEHVSLAFDDNVVLHDVSFAVNRGEMKILLGGSGSGKSVTLKLIVGLLRPARAPTPAKG